MSDFDLSGKILKPDIHFEFSGGPMVDGFLPKSIKVWLSDIAKREQRQIESLHYYFCDDSALLEINKQFLDHDTFTDIITFPYSYDPIRSEIYISTERIVENAEIYSAGNVLDELLRVICHGLLHLCGHDDKTEEEKNTMRKLESKYIARYFTDY